MRQFVDKLLAAHGFERILDVPAVPTGNRSGVRLPMQVKTNSGTWQLRAFGTDFSLISRPWLRVGMFRCYSMGWGFVDERSNADLLLAEAFLAEQEQAEQLGRRLCFELSPLRSRWQVDRKWNLHRLRLAAARDA
ncbi:hypothetical protein [Nocardia sp. NPDC059691]|uniref:hypothetical protein n=1 Tax=Nocardia sp. NPDC059691 TaxID=3346908 RepID=UPI00368D4B10